MKRIFSMFFDAFEFFDFGKNEIKTIKVEVFGFKIEPNNC